MQLRTLVQRFYDELWNERNLGVADEILAPAVSFRGSLGTTRTGRAEVCDYVREVTSALDDYRCVIDHLVVEDSSAAARLTFSGIHRGVFLGRAPTGSVLRWAGAAFFRGGDSLIGDVWVLGDLVNLYAQLDGTSA